MAFVDGSVGKPVWLETRAFAKWIAHRESLVIVMDVQQQVE